MCFFLPSVRVELLPIFEKKHLILVDKKHFEKNKFISGNKKTLFQLCLFSSPLLPLFKIGQNCFYFVALINFSRNVSSVFLFGRPH